MPGYSIFFFSFKHICDDNKLNCFVMFDKCNFSFVFFLPTEKDCKLKKPNQPTINSRMQGSTWQSTFYQQNEIRYLSKYIYPQNNYAYISFSCINRYSSALFCLSFATHNSALTVGRKYLKTLPKQMAGWVYIISSGFLSTIYFITNEKGNIYLKSIQ